MVPRFSTTKPRAWSAGGAVRNTGVAKVPMFSRPRLPAGGGGGGAGRSFPPQPARPRNASPRPTVTAVRMTGKFRSMRAIVYVGAGGSEVVAVREVPDPGLRPKHVLVRVKAAGLNR